jgi:ATP-dependent Clp protease ATP-binding subunit ClpC
MQGINLAIDENLIDYVVGFGTDPKFGARPMNRAIQDKVEEAVARKILADSIPKGQEIRLNQGDFS